MIDETAPASRTEILPKPQRVLVLGATGTIGRAVTKALIARGHDVVCFVRPRAGRPVRAQDTAAVLGGAEVRFGDVTKRDSLAENGFRCEPFDVLVSCLASRTGAPDDARLVDYKANLNALAAARALGVRHMVLLSAICVQKPQLAFQHAKLAFEEALIESGLKYSIVRPTAYFKSLSGQVERVRRGKPFLVFGDGRLTSCKPIGDGDLAHYIARCLDEPDLQNKILPIGGPGDAITPKTQGEHLFQLLRKKPRFKHVPVRLLDGIVATLAAGGRIVPVLAGKAEFARIGRYYATESMLVFDPKTGLYDAAATPSTGTETLFDFYGKLIRGEATVDRGDHAVF